MSGGETTKEMTTMALVRITREQIAAGKPGVVIDKIMTVHCRACQHQWAISMTLPTTLRKFQTLTDGVVLGGCPACGKRTRDNILVGPVRG